jgi:hypothetical protein
MRAYSVDAAAFALGVDRKFLDNLLSHHALPGCTGGRQGLRRRIARDGVVRLAIAVTLARELGMPLARAIELACRLHAERSAEPAPALRITVDLPALERDLDARLALAMESAREPRRGRPPAARSRRAAAPTAD